MSKTGLRRFPRALLLGALGVSLVATAPASATATASGSPATVVVAVSAGRSAEEVAQRHGLVVERPVFRGHTDWNIWRMRGAAASATALASQLNSAPGVRWAEADLELSMGNDSGAGTAPAGTAPSSVTAPTSAPAQIGRGVAQPVSADVYSAPVSAASFPPATTPSVGPAAPPTSCTPALGLADGTPFNARFCNEPNGPYYTEEWNNFCFLPTTQSDSVLAGAPNAPKAAGMCSQGAWRLGASGQGTVIAILDSGVDYNHPDLRMADEVSDPMLNDAAFPGTASDGHKHGWNFYDDNAEPMDYYGHGTGRAGIAAAQADAAAGGHGGMVGVAPRARLMAVKVGDTYVVHSENLAEGVVYAADHGADVIETALGAVGNSRLLREAGVYAYGKGIFWAAATANEYSTHHNFPTDMDTVSGAGGLGPELAVQSEQTCSGQCAPAQPQSTFLQKVNYANFAGIQAFATPIDTLQTNMGGGEGIHAGGTSTATPHLAGSGAVVRSAGFTVGMCQGHAVIDAAYDPASCTSPALTSNEVRQLLAYTATRIHNDDPGTNNYPLQPSGDPSAAAGEYYPEQGGDPHLGWNIWSGYGRPDLYAATAYAQAGLVPPEAQMFGDTPPLTPAFQDGAGKPLVGAQLFGIYNPQQNPNLPIVGHVGATHLPAGQRVDWKVQVAPCLEPKEADFSTIANGTGARDGVLASWHLPTTATATCASAGISHPFSYPGTYTIRVLSQLDASDGSVLPRANPVAALDPNYASAPAPAPLAGQDRRVVFVRPANHDHLGSPYYLGASGEGSPTLYDIEGRGELDVIQATADGTIVALRPDGTPVPGWPVSTDPMAAFGPAHPTQPINGQPPRAQVLNSVAIGDIDGDGQPEIVAASGKGGLYAWHRDGSRVAGFPVTLAPPPQYTNPPANATVAGLPYCSQPHPATAFEQYSDYGAIAAPVLADVEGRHDGSLDIVQAEANDCVYAVRPNGTIAWQVFPSSTTNGKPFKIAATPAVGDLDGNGVLDVVVGTEETGGSLPNTFSYLWAFNGVTGAVKPGWPVNPPSISASGVPAVATGMISSPALLPRQGGGVGLDVADGVFLGGDPKTVTLYHADGTASTSFDTTHPGAGSNVTDLPFHWGVTQTVVGKLGSGTALNVATGGFGTLLASDTAAAPGKKTQFQHEVAAFDASTGLFASTFPRQIEDWQFFSGPAIADVKGDGTRQLIEGSGEGLLHAFDPNGTSGVTLNFSTTLNHYADYSEPTGFPVFEGTGYITSTPAVAQLTRGGPVTVASVTRDGYLFLTDTSGQVAANDQWWHFHHDERNTGQYGVDTRPPATATDLRASLTPSPPGIVSLSWTEVGDDWWTGQLDHFDARWSLSPITDANFLQAHPIPPGPPPVGPVGQAPVNGPVAPGQPEQVFAQAPTDGTTVYFAERGIDAHGNVGLLGFTTLGAPPPNLPEAPSIPALLLVTMVVLAAAGTGWRVGHRA